MNAGSVNGFSEIVVLHTADGPFAVTLAVN